MLLFICGKGKDEYLTGEAAMPETTKPGFKKWKIENSMIMSWPWKKISVITDISVLRFYGYIGYISDISEIYRRIFWKKISVDLKLLKTHGNARKTS